MMNILTKYSDDEYFDALILHIPIRPIHFCFGDLASEVGMCRGGFVWEGQRLEGTLRNAFDGDGPLNVYV